MTLAQAKQIHKYFAGKSNLTGSEKAILKTATQKIRSSSRATSNPVANRNGVLIYGRTLEIRAQKTQKHACDAECKRNGHRYKHPFKGSTDAAIYGLPNGDLLIRGKRNLWKIFDI